VLTKNFLATARPAERTTCETARILSVLWTASLQPEVDWIQIRMAVGTSAAPTKPTASALLDYLEEPGLVWSCPMHRKRYMLQSEVFEGNAYWEARCGKRTTGFERGSSTSMPRLDTYQHEVNIIGNQRVEERVSDQIFLWLIRRFLRQDYGRGNTRQVRWNTTGRSHLAGISEYLFALRLRPLGLKSGLGVAQRDTQS